MIDDVFPEVTDPYKLVEDVDKHNRKLKETFDEKNT